MGVVDRDGLDGLLRAPSVDATATVGPGAVSLRRPRADSMSGLLALANASHPCPPVDPTLASWTALEPLALMPTDVEHDTRVDDGNPFEPATRVEGGEPDSQATLLRDTPQPPTRIGRHARPTVQPPPGRARSRLRRPTGRIVLSFMSGGAALAAAILLMTLQAAGVRGSESRASLPGGQAARQAARVATVAATAEARPHVRAASAAPAPVLAATIDRRVLRRQVVPVVAVLPGGRLQWRVPARYSLGGEAPDVIDNESLAALVAELGSRCTPGTIVVTGHTCNVGSIMLNFGIGKRRARFVRDLLVTTGLPARAVRVASAASLRPEASNETAAGRERNRRVTVACQPLRQQARGEE